MTGPVGKLTPVGGLTPVPPPPPEPVAMAQPVGNLSPVGTLTPVAPQERPGLGTRFGRHFDMSMYAVDQPPVGLGSDAIVNFSDGHFEMEGAKLRRGDPVEKAKMAGMLAMGGMPLKSVRQEVNAATAQTPENKERADKLELEGLQKKAAWTKAQAERQSAYDALPPAEGFWENAAAVGGRLGAGMAQPENLIPIGSGAAAGSKILRGAGQGVLAGAGIGALIEPQSQATAIRTGQLDGPDPALAAENIGLSGLAGGIFGAVPPTLSAGLKALKRGRGADVPPEIVAPVEPVGDLEPVRPPSESAPLPENVFPMDRPVEPDLVEPDLPVRSEIPPDVPPIDLPDAKPDAPKVTITPEKVRDPKVNARAVEGDVFAYKGRNWEVSEVFGPKDPVVVKSPDGIEMVFDTPGRMSIETGIKLDRLAMKAAEPPKIGKSLAEFVRSTGRINKTEAEALIGKSAVKDLDRQYKGLFRANGRSLDEIRESVGPKSNDRFIDIDEAEMTPDAVLQAVIRDVEAMSGGSQAGRVFRLEDAEATRAVSDRRDYIERLKYRATDPENMGLRQAADLADLPIGIKAQQQARINAEAANRAIEEKFQSSSDAERAEIADAQMVEVEDLLIEARRYYDDAERVPDTEFEEGVPATREDLDKRIEAEDPASRERSDGERARQEPVYESEPGSVAREADGDRGGTSQTEPAEPRTSETEGSQGQGANDDKATSLVEKAFARLKSKEVKARPLSSGVPDGSEIPIPRQKEFLRDAIEDAPKGTFEKGALQALPVLKQGAKAFASVVEEAAGSMDAVLRAVGRRVAKAHDAPEVQKVINDLADLIHVQAGKTKGKSGYWLRMTQRANEKQNAASSILKGLRVKSKERGLVFNQTVEKIPLKVSDNIRMLATGKQARGATPQEIDAAKGVREWFDEWLEFRRESGEEIGEVSDYINRSFNVEEVRNNPNLFVQRAQGLYEEIYGDAEKARGAASELLDNVLVGRVQAYRSKDFSSDNTKSRKFGAMADDFEKGLAKFYERDIEQIMSSYNMGAAKSAEQARVKPQIEELTERLRKQLAAIEGSGEKIEYDVLDHVERYFNTQFNPYDETSSQRTMRGVASAFTYTGLLGKALITSLPEGLLIPLQYGTNTRTMKGMIKTYTQLPKLIMSELNGKTYQEKAFAELMGVVTDPMNDAIMSNRLGLEMMGQDTQKAVTRFMRKIALEQFTRNTRIQAAWTGRADMAQHAQKILTGKPAKKSRSIKAFKELGVSDPEGFAKWIDSHDGFPPAADVKASKGFASDYKLAVAKYVEMVVMDPNRAEKPLYASRGPFISLMYSLQSYNYSAFENIVKRNARMMTGDDFELLPVAANLSLWVPAYLGMVFGLEKFRELTYGDEQRAKRDEELGSKKLLRALDRSPFLGPQVSTILNATAGTKYQRNVMESLVGPFWGRLGDQATAIAKLFRDNSENTNTAERNAAYATYDLTVKPLLDLGVAFSGIPTPLAMGFYGYGSDQLRDAVVDGVAGEPTKRKRKGGPK